MRPSLLSASASLIATLAVLASACSSTPQQQSRYEEYKCPDPIGQIVREDCSQAGLRYEGMHAEAKVDVGKLGGASGSYKDQAIREADDLIAVLKEQRVALCHDFNTCKMTVQEYRMEKVRVDSSFTAVVAMKDNLQKMDSGSALKFLEQLRSMREGPNHATTTPAPSASAQASAPPAPPPAPTPAPTAAPPPPPPAAQKDYTWIPGKFMLQAVGRVVEAAKKLTDTTKFGFDTEHASMLGAFVNKGASIDITQSFKGGREYILIAGGTDNALDVDLGILDDKGKILASDTNDDPTPVVSFKPKKDGNYTIRVVLDKSKASGNFIALAVMHEGGYSIPANTIVSSIRHAIGNAVKLAQKVEAGGGQLVFHESGNWAFYGTVLKPQIMSTFGGLVLTTDPTIALAGADDDGTNIDLYLKDDKGTMVAKDENPDAEPAILVHPDSKRTYSLSVANAAKKGSTLATLLVLDAKK
jgi:hypothetical protein